MAAAGDDAPGAGAVDWRSQERRPFKRRFFAAPLTAPEEVHARRQALGLDVVQEPGSDWAVPAPITGYEEVGVVPAWLLEALQEDEQSEPTALQAQAVPLLLSGRSVVAVARPQSGQVAAFVVPAAVHVEDQPALSQVEPGPVVLVLVPSQDLAAKATEEVAHLLRLSSRSTRHAPGLRCVNVSGGGVRSEKLKEMGPTGAHFIVGTPKRVLDMASKGQISLLRVTLLVVDGADRMLDFGFGNEIRAISDAVRPERQVVLFAGTWPRPLAELAKELCFGGGRPIQISVTAGGTGVAAPEAASPTAGGQPTAKQPGGAAATKRPAPAAATGPAGKAKAKAAKAAPQPQRAPLGAVKEVAVEAEDFPEDW